MHNRERTGQTKNLWIKDGKYVAPDGEWAKSEYPDLIDIDRLELNHEDY
jgi:hypothetical protein